MAEEEKQISICPNCNTEYLVPPSFEGKTVACKKCGEQFQMTFTGRKVEGSASQGAEAADAEVIKDDDSFLIVGKLALQFKFVTREMVQKALSIQKEAKAEDKELPFGQILLDEGFISKQQLDFILSVQKMREIRALDAKFGQIAVKNELCNEKDIEKALAEQKNIFTKTRHVALIGDILIKYDCMTQEQRDNILIAQNRMKGPAAAGEKALDSLDGADGSDTPESATVDLDDIFQLKTTEGNLQALISPKTRDIPGNISAALVVGFLNEKGISYGIIDEEEITKYLTADPFDQTPFEIAKGLEAVPAKDEVVEYFFETDPLIFSKDRKGKTVDHQLSEDIPKVNTGDVLAEKTRGKEGQDGFDVYGENIEATKIEKINLRTGKGALLSEDMLQVTAEIDGRAEVSVDGIISVSNEINIQGDVSVETGDIDFDGSVIVSGAIQDGFKVKAQRLEAKEVFKAELNIAGDIAVRGGILGAKIISEGNLRAKFINSAQIEALGNISVEKEVVDSKLETSTKFLAGSCKILSSQIVANKGIEVGDVGSDMSRPCSLTVGVDVKVRRQILKLKEQVTVNKKKHDKLGEQVEQLKNETNSIDEKMTEPAQVQDRSTLKRREVEAKLAEFEEAGDEKRAEKAKEIIAQLTTGIEKAETTINELMERQDNIFDEIPAIEEKVKDIDLEIETLNNEINRLNEYSEKEKGTPTIKASGTIYSGTVIVGPHASMTVSDNLRFVNVNETKVDVGGSSSEWVIGVSPLR